MILEVTPLELAVALGFLNPIILNADEDEETPESQGADNDRQEAVQ